MPQESREFLFRLFILLYGSIKNHSGFAYAKKINGHFETKTRKATSYLKISLLQLSTMILPSSGTENGQEALNFVWRLDGNVLVPVLIDEAAAAGTLLNVVRFNC